MNRNITIIYVSRSGNTELMVRAAAEGAEAAGAKVNIKEAADATGADVEQCDALIWGCGNYYGYIHGRLKDWFDRELMRLSRKSKLGEMKPRPYFCCLSARANPHRHQPIIERLSAGINLKKVFEPVTSINRPSEEVLALCRARGRELVSVNGDEILDLYVPVPIDVPQKKVDAVPKPVILMVVPEDVDAALPHSLAKERFKDYEVRLVPAGDLADVYREMGTQGKTNLAVAPLALADDELCRSTLTSQTPGLNVEYAWPLLASPESVARVVKILLDDRKEGTMMIVCPSGDPSNPALLRLDRLLRRSGSMLFKGSYIVGEIRAAANAVSLRPLSLTPSNNSCIAVMSRLAGELEAAGVKCSLERGLDYYARILAIWLDDVARALDWFAVATK